jgi:hypothetical protein
MKEQLDKNEKPSKFIERQAETNRNAGIDPGFSRYPSTENWVDAIIEYLDQNEVK